MTPILRRVGTGKSHQQEETVVCPYPGVQSLTLTMILSLSSDPQLAFWAVSQGLTPFPVLAAGQLMQVFLLLGEGEVG